MSNDSPNSLFDDAVRRMEHAARYAEIDDEAVERLKHTKAAVEVAVPVRMDDGSLRIFTGYRVRHDDTRGPTKGGIRFHPDVNVDVCRALAFWMTCKTAAMGLPFGGGKGGVAVNPKELSRLELERLSRGYVREIAEFIGPDRDIPAPDVYTNETIMGWMVDEYAKITRRHTPAVMTGKPVPLGGTFGRAGATGRGAHVLVRHMAERLGWTASQTTVAVQGFGNAGQRIAQLLYDDGYKVVAVSDSSGAIYNTNGLDVPTLIEHKNRARQLEHVYAEGALSEEANEVEHLSNEQMLELDVHLLIPAAMSNAITKNNAGNIQARAIVELANGPVTSNADPILAERDVLVVPDILANAGGVTVSYYEWVQNRQGYYWSAEDVDRHLSERMRTEFDAVYAIRETKGIDMRTAAYVHALSRLGDALHAQGTQRFFNPEEA